MPVVRVDPLAGGAQRAAGGRVCAVRLRPAALAATHAPQLRLHVQGGALAGQWPRQQLGCNRMHGKGQQLMASAGAPSKQHNDVLWQYEGWSCCWEVRAV